MLTALLLTALLAAPPFEPAATLRALRHDEGRASALKVLDALSPAERAAAAAFDERAIPRALAELAADAEARIGHRLLAVEVLARLAALAAVEPLSERLRHTGTPEEIAVARAAAVALRGLGARAALAPAATSPDPEVRATVAGAAAAPDTLCAALKDPWPVVRAAAARGLAGRPAESPCLLLAFDDRDAPVRIAAIQAAGQAGVKAAAPPLRALAAETNAPLPLRVEAVVALGRLGDTEPAQKVLNTHLAKGGIVPLALGAVAALAAADRPESRETLRRALDSKAESVVAGAALALAALRDTEARPALERARERVHARHREAVEQALERLAPGAAPATGSPTSDDPAAADPE